MEKRSFLKVAVISVLVLGLAVSICSAEIQTVSKEGVIKTASYGNGYRFDEMAGYTFTLRGHLMREVSSMDTWWLQSLRRLWRV